MDKALLIIFPSVPQNSFVVICLKKTSLLSPPLLLHHIFFMFPPFTMAVTEHRITMQMCSEQGGGNIGEVEEVLVWKKF